MTVMSVFECSCLLNSLSPMIKKSRKHERYNKQIDRYDEYA